MTIGRDAAEIKTFSRPGLVAKITNGDDGGNGITRRSREAETRTEAVRRASRSDARGWVDRAAARPGRRTALLRSFSVALFLCVERCPPYSLLAATTPGLL